MKEFLQVLLCNVVLVVLPFTSYSQKPENNSNVKVVGAMKNVMRQGELFGTISLDTIGNLNGLYGLGPIEYLRGELFIVDGVTYTSRLRSDSTMIVESTNKVKAPFFVYANVEKWEEVEIPKNVKTLIELEHFIDRKTKKSIRPFAFRLTGVADFATIHVVNLPEGRKVTSPEEAHEGLVPFEIRDKAVEIVGFFSTEHKTIFTHHDTYIHAHLISEDKSQMGHLEAVEFSREKMKLYIQVQ